MAFLKLEGMGDNTFVVKVSNAGVDTIVKDSAGTPIKVNGIQAQALLEFFNKRQDAQPTNDIEQAIVDIIG